jgi:hypothetical protein
MGRIEADDATDDRQVIASRYHGVNRAVDVRHDAVESR